MTRIGILQMNSGIEPGPNARMIAAALKDTAQDGAAMLFTPEMCGLLDRDRLRAAANIQPEYHNDVLEHIRAACAAHNIWCAVGSLPITLSDGTFANRSFVIDGSGAVVARYDKMHMFDVDLDSGESWRESSSYRAGDDIVMVDTPAGKLGLAICYDIRFPALFDALGKGRCDIIAIPAAFTVPTGRDHWEVLLRARAIEASAYVVAAAQAGRHEDGRQTYGHSLVADPWGKVVLDMKMRTGLGFVEISKQRIADVRRQLPSLANRRNLAGCEPK